MRLSFSSFVSLSSSSDRTNLSSSSDVTVRALHRNKSLFRTHAQPTYVCEMLNTGNNFHSRRKGADNGTREIAEHDLRYTYFLRVNIREHAY